jgi:hypothetical protein
MFMPSHPAQTLAVLAANNINYGRPQLGKYTKMTKGVQKLPNIAT